MIALIFAAGLISADAQAILDQGRWGLITEDLSESAVAAARTCDGAWISFAFTATEIQIIPHQGKAPPHVPPEIYAAARLRRDDAAVVELFTAAGDAKPSRVYTYDQSVRSLMRMMDDGDGDALYVLCD